MVNQYDIGDVIVLDEEKEYNIINKYKDYYILISSIHPINIIVGKFVEDTLVVEKNKDIICEVLTNMKVD